MCPWHHPGPDALPQNFSGSPPETPCNMGCACLACGLRPGDLLGHIPQERAPRSCTVAKLPADSNTQSGIGSRALEALPPVWRRTAQSQYEVGLEV